MILYKNVRKNCTKISLISWLYRKFLFVNGHGISWDFMVEDVFDRREVVIDDTQGLK